MSVFSVCVLLATSACFTQTNAQRVLSPLDDEHDPWINPPWKNFQGRVVTRTIYGDIRGFSIPWHIDDEIWNPRWQDEPPWYTRRINCFLGIPYALPPVGYRRFQRPEKPRWGGEWDGTYFRHACSQDISHLQKDIPTYPKANISEDCLYMNVFSPNLTDHWRDRTNPTLYPVMVWIHGGDFLHGSAQLLPGHVLATKEVVIVTFNYRLGAFGFLSTEDVHAPGNWGLFDQQLALEFIKENIKVFQGDPNRITLCGEGAGAASVGLHMVSPISRNKGFYHQAVLMSGSDLSTFAYVRPAWRPREYASRLAELLNCPTHHPYDMLDCLRQSKDILWAQSLVKPHDGDLGVVWAPVQDSGYRVNWPFLPVTPSDSRQNHQFEKVPILIGLNTQDGAEKANSSIRGLEGGISSETFDHYVDTLLHDWRIQHTYLPRAKEAVLFQYTHWPDPQNRSARGQEFINLMTDLLYGVGINDVVKVQSLYAPSYLYQFNYKSWNDWLPYWMGVSFSAALPYVFGVPFMNETVLNETKLEPRQYYDYEDRNISDWMMYMWTNFAKYGDPTPNITWNVTWGPFNPRNLSYLIIDHHSHLGLRYRQNKYGFWTDYFPHAFKHDQFVPTPTPTPSGYEYVIATGCVSVLLIILIAIAIILVLLLIFAGRSREMESTHLHDLPASFSRSQSQSTVMFSSKSSLPQHSVV